ncbi:hypothetical protein SMACR_02521 [Sordaria macrospora]|uniref:WGS project CABT00000000 data, contig 2.3 n=2 Tax=Sordaria macrospora TaxID=5147 RepID=F7VPU0_SORMK|nr:uncharacterized protein SMAC_02521 [Sordaria macrospora k-hell]KAA8631539.1 hypothetical protein SMACR_02521 [Sordaria macrospora]WPJ64912.1 hypothetical protein SMAC4_02521 [Sordaria macrospora]CCC07518.1 unnamed protein product [Sordaria macrospora k-hell]
MGKPRLIILIRHAQSEGNKNRDIHQTIPDHRVKLTEDGWQQAYDAGRRLRKLLRADDTIQFFTSPYRRTRETTEGILATLTSDDPEPSPFKRNHIKVYEEPRLREQDFGNFQPCSAEMERMWQERADYGHFFYRIPNGESAADAYDRVSGFNESLWRQFNDDDFASVCVLVTHGLMSRVFLMKWYHFSVEYFEDLRNVNHCEFLIMRKNDNGKYLLENKLRTWSELKKEKATQQALLTGGNSKLDSAPSTTPRMPPDPSAPPVEMRRRWGGCPNGCNHDKNFKIRSNLADLVKTDHMISSHVTSTDAIVTDSASGNSTDVDTPSVGSSSIALTDGAGPGKARGVANASFNGTAQPNGPTIASRRPTAKHIQSTSSGVTLSPEVAHTGPVIDITKAREEVVSSPDGTPSFISIEDRLRSHLKSPSVPPRPHSHGHSLHIGRDGGGTYSGHSSSETELSEDERQKIVKIKTPSGGLTPLAARPAPHRHSSRDRSQMGRGAKANRLGDHPPSSDGEHEADGEHEPDCEEDEENSCQGQEEGAKLTESMKKKQSLENLTDAEKDDRSLRGSVY